MSKRRGIRVKHAKDEKIIANPMQFLADSGLLYRMNLTLFHPIGLALTGEVDKRTGKLVFCRIVDHREDPSDVFGSRVFDLGRAKFEAFMQREGNGIMARRKQKLGFVVQATGEIKEGG